MSDNRDQIAEWIASEPAGSPAEMMAVLERAAKRFPDASEADIDAALDRAIEILEERASRHTSERDAMLSVSALFDGMPEGMELGECARIKAERGDPLALAFLEWERKQAGGLQ